MMIECPRGIPYRLRLVDEAGAPVDAEVSYYSVFPSPIIYHDVSVLTRSSARIPLSRAKRQDDGTTSVRSYPVPALCSAKISRGGSYRPAHVDPKVFFAPGRTDWKRDRTRSRTYGNHDDGLRHTLSGSWLD